MTATTNQTSVGTLVVRVDDLNEFLLTKKFHPNRRKFLQSDWEELLVQEARTMANDVPFRLQLQCPASEILLAQTLQQMVKHHFLYLHKTAKQQQKNTLTQGYKYLGIALFFLLLMTIFYSILENLAPENKFANTAQDALVILGWVAFWRPAELLLYEWHPIRYDAKLYERLAAMTVEITTF